MPVAPGLWAGDKKIHYVSIKSPVFTQQSFDTLHPATASRTIQRNRSTLEMSPVSAP
jgi:hypothetical protein